MGWHSQNASDALVSEAAKPVSSLLNTAVVMSSLGYFVDIYDLVIFSIVRIPSLQSLGVTGADLMSRGVALLNIQMAGMLIGGIFFGVLGDKRGRVSVLYGSILLYSLANIANAFATSFESYAVFRFLAGVGLAGELGAAVTLVTELMSTSTRGLGVALVAAIGILGATLAAFVSEIFSWQTAYLVGGGMGLLLLAYRVKMSESALFHSLLRETSIKKGSFSMFLTNRQRFVRYISCIFIGSPTWFIVGVLVGFAPEITAALGATETVTVAKGIGWLYLGLALGDLLSGLLSQFVKSRKKAVLLFSAASLPVIALYLTSSQASAMFYYSLFFVLGIGSGYWAVFVTIAAEQFGTNLRATAATTVPNFVRAMVIPLTLGVQTLKTSFGLIPAVGIVAVAAFSLAYLALYFLEETHGKDLNFIEH